VTFTAVPGNGGTHPDYQWMINGVAAGSDTAVFSTDSLQDGDNVSVLLNGSLYCSIPVTSVPITMTVYPLPVILLPPDTVIAGGTSIRLDPVITGQAVSWQWSPATWLDNPAVSDPLASPITTTTYSLLVTTDKGCYATAKEIVAVFYDLLMPNAFTPNGDGKNDVFRIPPIVPVKIIRFVVYDRWGELVFSTADSGAGWDGRLAGKPQPAGTYVWMIEYNDPLVRKAVLKHGTVVLIR
jgi:gliding motility-associated-like protein